MKEKRKLTLENIAYLINSWMYMEFGILFLITYYLTLEKIWLCAGLITFVFYFVEIIREIKRSKRIKRGIRR